MQSRKRSVKFRCIGTLIFRLKILSSVSILNTLYLDEEDGCYAMPCHAMPCHAMASTPQKDDKK
jgi:hypothetical protein